MISRWSWGRKKTLYAVSGEVFDLLRPVLADKFKGVGNDLKEVTRAQPPFTRRLWRELLADATRIG